MMQIRNKKQKHYLMIIAAPFLCTALNCAIMLNTAWEATELWSQPQVFTSNSNDKKGRNSIELAGQ